LTGNRILPLKTNFSLKKKNYLLMVNPLVVQLPNGRGVATIARTQAARVICTADLVDPPEPALSAPPNVTGTPPAGNASGTRPARVGAAVVSPKN
jgi:hypothetical protein